MHNFGCIIFLMNEYILYSLFFTFLYIIQIRTFVFLYFVRFINAYLEIILTKPILYISIIFPKSEREFLKKFSKQFAFKVMTLLSAQQP